MMKNKFNIFYTLLSVTVIVASVYLGFKLGVNRALMSNVGIEVKTPVTKINKILQLISDRYVDSISIDELVESSIPLIVEQLDPHSTYFVPEDLKVLDESLQGSFEGVGISFNMTTDTIVVINVIEGGPANRSGVEAGDRIIRIDDSIVAGKKMDSNDVMKMLRGEAGTKVSIDIQRKGFDKEIPIIITRAKIPVKSVDVSYMINDSIGFIKLSTFSRTTYNEFIAAATKLKKQGMKKLIIDLRSNTGGYMDQAIKIADEFFSEKVLIVYTEGYNYPRENFYSPGKGRLADIDVNIIINEITASASEIVSGAIQDNDRGTIVGRRSFGKGLVQIPIPFSDGSGLNLTVGRYHTPTGRCIQKPYDKGLEQYNHDLFDRLLNNEFFAADNIQFNDSLKYTTPKGKTVYGGGGIMPDIFVAFDTIESAQDFFSKISQKNLVYNFVMNYTDRNRETINKITNFEQLDDFLGTQNIFDTFLNYAAANGINAKNSELAEVKKILEPELKGLIGRNTPLDNEGFYPYYGKIDVTLQKAIECFTEIEE
ncbi:MAG: S41 family peptidase [Prevotellaceae bacterium]|jgi:carboxyl-terminal processing protease|nr:S41 family peptidase [Prevotellaceae bacterium]